MNLDPLNNRASIEPPIYGELHEGAPDSSPRFTAAVRDGSERAPVPLPLSTYRDIFLRSPFGYLTLHWPNLEDPSSLTLTDLNPAAEQLLALNGPSSLGNAIITLFPETASSRLLDEIRDVARAGVAQKWGEMELKDGPLRGRLFEVSAFPLPASSIGLCFEDITQQRRIAKELKRQTQEAGTLSRDLDSFRSSVSHDLRAPLRAIDGFSQALLDDCAETLDETARNHLERVRVNAQRMGQLIDDILYLSKISRASLSPAPVDLSKLALEISDQLIKDNPNRAIRVSIEGEASATGDARLLRIVLENLLSNAWKFTAKTKNALIEFFTAPRDGLLLYCVRDNGAGFDPAYSHRLFHVFQRLHSTNDFPGTGVGLATVQRVIEKHGGRVFAEGCPGVGATFSFTLQGRG